MKRYNEQTKFSAEIMANILQNVSQNRSNKAITKSDMQNAFTAAFFNIYPDNNFDTRMGVHKHGHWSEIFIYYIKGNDDGTASVCWAYSVHQINNDSVMDSPLKIGWTKRESYNNRSHVNIKRNSDPSAICSELSINPGETKIILEACVEYATYCTLPNGNSCSTIDYSKILGFYIVRPKSSGRISEEKACFHSVVIFTPKPGTFDPNNPPP